MRTVRQVGRHSGRKAVRLSIDASAEGARRHGLRVTNQWSDPVANRWRKPSKPQQRGTSQRSWSNSLQMAIARSTLLGKGWYTPLARGSRSNPSSRAAILREQLH